MIHLSNQERQIVRLLVDAGAANKEIAARLHLAEGTVKVYMNHIFRKVGVNSRLELALAALRLGLVPPPPPAA